jgi:sulfoxide reductase heme-binding subunit YedZ
MGASSHSVANFGNLSVQRQRLWRRLWMHHLALAAISGLAVFLLYTTRPFSDVISRLSFATAYPALVLLALTLWMGPWNVLRRQRMPVSSDLRRDVGIWAGILGLLHTAVGLNVHLRGRPWLYFFYGHTEGHHWLPIRHDLFGFSNYTGLAATALLVLLFATSNDYFLRRLGTPQWKRLQRWNYALFALTLAHAFGYQTVETQKLPWVALVIVCAVLTLGFQLFGYWNRRQQRGTPATSRM